MKKHLIACSLLALFATTGAQAADKLRMGIVVKIGGIPWFNAMEAGIKSEALPLPTRRCRCAPLKI